ncbi:hypothetical protein MES5069_350024 [Mesorhizobium escarrei]|uniref:Uncharacterized protein n=1 Tax=Mesorhizobium escarrei TaxID=666018 RepID=A0ABM9E0Z3_9HYPH|nr:hypothetical protein MES5069_350024 [Mesorhizobium escarrei]
MIVVPEPLNGSLWLPQRSMQCTAFLLEPRRTRAFWAAEAGSENSFTNGLAEGRELESNILQTRHDGAELLSAANS